MIELAGKQHANLLFNESHQRKSTEVSRDAMNRIAMNNKRMLIQQKLVFIFHV